MDLGAVTWAGGGAWPACLLFWRERAQKAGHVARGARPSLRPRPLGGRGGGRRRLRGAVPEAEPAVLAAALVFRVYLGRTAVRRGGRRWGVRRMAEEWRVHVRVAVRRAEGAGVAGKVEVVCAVR